MRNVICARLILFTFALIGQRTNVLGVSVCLSVCLCECEHISEATDTSQLHQLLLLILPMAVARSSSAGVAIRYVFPVLRMASQR